MSSFIEDLVGLVSKGISMQATRSCGGPSVEQKVGDPTIYGYRSGMFGQSPAASTWIIVSARVPLFSCVL